MVSPANGNGHDGSPRRPAPPRPAGGERAPFEDRRAQGQAEGREGGRIPGPVEGRRRAVPRPLRTRPISLRAARAGGRPPGPIPLPAYRVEGGGADRTPGPGRAGANRTGATATAGPGAAGGAGGGVAGETGTVTRQGSNQDDDIRRSLWVRRPDLFYGKPNRGSHRAAFVEPLAPERDQLTGGDRLAALRRQGVERVPAARELLPVGHQGVPAAARYSPVRPAEDRVDQQVAEQVTRRPSPSSQGRPIAQSGRTDVAAGTVRWEAAEEPAPAPAAGRGDPAADVTAPPASERADALPSPDGDAAVARDEAGQATVVQEVGGAPVPLTPEAVLSVATGPNADASVGENLAATLRTWAGHEVAPRSRVAGEKQEGAGNDTGVEAPTGAGALASGAPAQAAVGAAPGGERLEAAAELRPRPRLKAPLRPRSFPQGKAATGIYGRPPGDRSTDATALTRGAIREARDRWTHQGREPGPVGEEGRTP